MSETRVTLEDRLAQRRRQALTALLEAHERDEWVAATSAGVSDYTWHHLRPEGLVEWVGLTRERPPRLVYRLTSRGVREA